MSSDKWGTTCLSAEVLTNEADSQRILDLIDLKAQITGMGKGIKKSVQWRNVSSGGLREVRLLLSNISSLEGLHGEQVKSSEYKSQLFVWFGFIVFVFNSALL